jgi:dihydropteroate synthase
MSAQPDLRQTLLTLSDKVQQLRDMGQHDIVVDPGFGFGKTLEQNYRLLAQLDRLQVLGLPVLVGLSRKSMLWKTLQTTPEEALNATTVANTVALMKGASVLRVHDVRECVEAVKIVDSMQA